MQKRTTLTLLLLAPLILALLVAMTISDPYYSDLEARYPILEQTEMVRGKVTDLIVIPAGLIQDSLLNERTLEN